MVRKTPRTTWCRQFRTMAAKAARVRSKHFAGWRYAYPAYGFVGPANAVPPGNKISTGLTAMAYTTFSQTKNDQLKEPMFFGQPVNVARYDQQKYDIFEKLIEKQLSFFWRPEEVDVSRDRIDFQALPEHEKHIFVSNLKYQTLLDSIQGQIGRASCRERGQLSVVVG